MANKTFVIGRSGDICIEDESISYKHAVLQLRDNEIYLRDLGSTYGTYLVKNNRPIRFYEGYVQLNQVVMFGNITCLINSLLEQVDQAPFTFNSINCA
ncbi:MAG: FHA domain-containing protein [Gammaproteobacteria bacterium]|nr:FHA domain-containing protein [Gammaproteobacteria bacterium]